MTVGRREEVAVFEELQRRQFDLFLFHDRSVIGGADEKIGRAWELRFFDGDNEIVVASDPRV